MAIVDEIRNSNVMALSPVIDPLGAHAKEQKVSGVKRIRHENESICDLKHDQHYRGGKKNDGQNRIHSAAVICWFLQWLFVGLMTGADMIDTLKY